jgi:hypothetical protein
MQLAEHGCRSWAELIIADDECCTKRGWDYKKKLSESLARCAGVDERLKKLPRR